MIRRSIEREIDLELQHKSKSVQVHLVEGPAKRPKNFDTRSRGQQVRDRYGIYRRVHEGTCRENGDGCFKCGKTGHFIRDYHQGSGLTFFQCN